MYDSGPSDEELALIGIRREDVEDTSVIEVWPENELPLSVFREVSSQWRFGPQGPTALDWNIVFRVMDLMGIKSKRQLNVIAAIRIMENAALRQINKDRPK